MLGITYRQKLGQWGEELAKDYLKRHQYLVLATNFHSQNGEIDIIAQKQGQFIFVEVKTRKKSNLQVPEESVDKRKLAKMQKTAEDYFLKNKIETEYYRFDIIAVEVDYSARNTTLRHIKAA